MLKVVEYLRKKFPDLAVQYTVRDSWLAKLGHWEEALERYEKRLAANPIEAAGKKNNSIPHFSVAQLVL